MAGKVLPIALATVSGIAIGVATFDSELKEQRTQMLKEAYRRDVPAATTSTSESATPANGNATKTKVTPSDSQESKPSGLSSLLGGWAWKRGGSPDSAVSTKSEATDAPPSRQP